MRSWDSRWVRSLLSLDPVMAVARFARGSHPILSLDLLHSLAGLSVDAVTGLPLDSFVLLSPDL
jgi:hypothetical protein